MTEIVDRTEAHRAESRAESRITLFTHREKENPDGSRSNTFVAAELPAPNDANLLWFVGGLFVGCLICRELSKKG